MMTYVFNINGDTKEFSYSDRYVESITEHTMEPNEGGMQEILKDKTGGTYPCYRDDDGNLYFEYDGIHVLCKNALNVLSPEELIRVLYGEYHSDNLPYHIVSPSYELCKTLQKYGLESIRFRINETPLTFDGWNGNKKIFSKNHMSKTPTWRFYHCVPCFNRMPIDDYKLHLEDRYHIYGFTHDIYTSDLSSMWIERPDYMQLELGELSEPNGIFGIRQDSDIIDSVKENNE